MPSGQDEELAALFRDLRRALDASQEDVAARLGTDVDVIRALEEGALLSLPPFAETSRIVIDYTSVLKLDARPILRRIHSQLAARMTQQTNRTPPQRVATPAQSAGGPPESRPRTAQPTRDPRRTAAHGQQTVRQQERDALGSVRPTRELPAQSRQGARASSAEARSRARPDLQPVAAPRRADARARETNFTPRNIEDAGMENHRDYSPARLEGRSSWIRKYGIYVASGLVTLSVLVLLIANPGRLIGALESMPQPFPTIAETLRGVVATDTSAPRPIDDPRNRKEDRLPLYEGRSG